MKQTKKFECHLKIKRILTKQPIVGRVKIRIINNERVYEKADFHKVYGQTTFIKERYVIDFNMDINSRNEYISKNSLRIEIVRLSENKLECINFVDFDILDMMKSGMRYFNGDISGEYMSPYGKTYFGLVVSIKEKSERENRFMKRRFVLKTKKEESKKKRIKSLEIDNLKKKELEKINNLFSIQKENDSENGIMNFWFVGKFILI